MGALTNLAAGAAAGYMQGKRLKKGDERAEKMDKVYEVLANRAIRDLDKPSPAAPGAVAPTDAAPVGSVGGAPYPVTPDGEQHLATGGMVGGCLPMGDRMMWQRQSFKK